MVKVNKKTFIKSKTEDNFPYLEVFHESSKKSYKLKVEVVKFVPDLENTTKKKVLLRQKVKVVYGKREVIKGTEAYEKLFVNEDLDLIRQYQRESTYIFSKIYTAYDTVPKDTTLEQVQEMVDSRNTACIYVILSNHPIAFNSKAALTVEEIEKQLLVYDYPEDDHKKGDLILDFAGKPQYKKSIFSLQEKYDVDLRTKSAEDYSLPEILKKKYNYAGN